MNFPSSELLIGRQRCRQWAPLLTQQLRLRHVTQLLVFNVASKKTDSFYFTVHLTAMCAPFYTSAKVHGPNLKWAEVDTKICNNTSASAFVLRVWKCKDSEMDKTVLTWGINLSGLMYIGNKIADVLPYYFKENSVIFYMHGGFFTSQHTIRTDLSKPSPFVDAMNIIGDAGKGRVYRCTSIKVPASETNRSYAMEKLRKLQSLQISIRNKANDVKLMKDKIDRKNGLQNNNSINRRGSTSSSPINSIRYEPQLLTMNCLNKMLQEKPSAMQLQEMHRIKKEIEDVKFKTKLLSHEKDRKSILIRKLREKYTSKVEENDLRNSDLMENYHSLSRETEKLKEIKGNLMHLKEIYKHLSLHVQHRRRQLMRQLLFIYPIERHSENKFVIHDIYLPNSDVLADCSDVGLSVALGYVTHILTMCSTFLQVPLRYPMIHYGSRSSITDTISPFLPDKEREFPLFTRGKEKMQFTYAVYLLNKNLAQLRWLFFMHTPDLKATLPNLLNFLEGPKDRPPAELLTTTDLLQSSVDEELKKSSPSTSSGLLTSEKIVSLRSFASSSNISDPILDCIRHENQLKISNSPMRKCPKRSKCRNVQCTKELAISEALLNKQISKDLFKNMIVDGYRHVACCGESSASPANSTASSTNNLSKLDETCDNEKILTDSIEQGTDPLDPASNLSTIISKTIKVYSDDRLEIKHNLDDSKRLSRSVGSYTDEDCNLKLNFEIGSEPLLNTSCDCKDEETPAIGGQQQFLQRWLESGPNLVCSEENLYPEEILGTSSGIHMPSKPLTARTDALLNTKSFNLVRPKQ